MPTATPGTVVQSGSGLGPGGDLGQTGLTGSTGPKGPTAVSADSGNIATLGSDSLILVPSSTLWSMRLRSFNAAGNPTFELDQANVNTVLTNPATATKIADRWLIQKSGTMNVNTQVQATSIKIPGTNFVISRAQLQLNLMTTYPTLASGDFLMIAQVVEGPQFRELSGDVHSLSLLVNPSGASLPMTFAVAIRDSPVTKSIVYLVTISTSGWQLVTIPNIPVFPSGNFSVVPGNAGYILSICLAAGGSLQASATGSWQSGNFIGAMGMTNWCGNVPTGFYIGFVQHEPGPVCTTLQDLDFATNLIRCQRYFQKAGYSYSAKPGTVDTNDQIQFLGQANQNPYTWLPFKCSMAKVPTLSWYSPDTGAVNNIRNASTGADLATTSTIAPGTEGCSGPVLTTPPTTVYVGRMHYTADTGW